MRTKREILEIKELFLQKFNKPTTELKFRNLYELIVCVMLSAQCTDKRVNLITPALFEQYPDINSLSKANLASVKILINSCSFFNNKAQNLIKMAGEVMSKFGGEIPLDEAGLKSLSGVEKDELFTKQLELAKRAIALRVYQEKQFQKIKVDAKEISDFYAQNKDKFVEPAQMKAKHILVKDENEAKEIIKELSNLKGADLDKKFTEIAKTKSIEPIASQSGGELGWFAAEQMVKPFSDAVSALKKGEITKTPVKTQFGFHVILKEDAKDKKQLTQDDVKQFIEENIKQEKFQQHIKDEGKMLREKAKIEYK